MIDRYSLWLGRRYDGVRRPAVKPWWAWRLELLLMRLGRRGRTA